MKFIYGVTCAVLFLAAVPVQAQGILFVQKETKGGKTTTNQIQIDKNFMRSESASDQTAVTFDGSKQTLRMLDTGKKTYQEITKADLDKLKQQMDGAMSQMQAQLASLPPAQRQMMEQMMQGRGMPGMPGMPAPAAPKPDYRAAGTDKIGQWACTKYEGYVNQQKTVEVCAADPKNFNLASSDFDVARQLAEFMKTLVPEGADRLIVNGTVQEQGYPGVAVRRTTFKDGAVESISEISELRREPISASTFEVPAGFKKESAPGARGAR